MLTGPTTTGIQNRHFWQHRRQIIYKHDTDWFMQFQWDRSQLFAQQEAPHRNLVLICGDCLDFIVHCILQFSTWKKEWNKYTYKVQFIALIFLFTHYKPMKFIYSKRDDSLKIPSHVILLQIQCSFLNHMTF